VDPVLALSTSPQLTQVKLINPMAYIGNGASTAPYWYVRHGTRDRDTAFTVSINLSRALAADSNVKDLNYRLAWNQPHAGNYDVPEAMAWIDATLKAATGKRAGTQHPSPVSARAPRARRRRG
jgi:hypothetical protein